MEKRVAAASGFGGGWRSRVEYGEERGGRIGSRFRFVRGPSAIRKRERGGDVDGLHGLEEGVD